MDLINQVCDVLSVIAKRSDEYHAINRKLKSFQGDFACTINHIDMVIEPKIIKLFDEILGEDMASYWLYECRGMKDGGKIIEPNGKEWRIKSIGDLKRYCRQLKKEKASVFN